MRNILENSTQIHISKKLKIVNLNGDNYLMLR
jgi:hypothetical protein